MRRVPDAIDAKTHLRPSDSAMGLARPRGRDPAAHDEPPARMFGLPEMRDGTPSGGGIRLGWKTSLLVNLMLLVTPTGLAIALPPVLECRERAERFGFFAGETARGCAERGIQGRLKRVDDRVKMLVRGSGA